MGCGPVLVVSQGFITCASVDCPRPTAALEILVQGEETGHVVEFKDDGYNCKHPLWERLDDQLLDCEIGDAISRALDMDPFLHGTYRYDGSTWWEMV